MDEQEFWEFQTKVVNELNSYREQKEREVQSIMEAVIYFVVLDETEQKEIIKDLKHILGTGAVFDRITFRETVFRYRKRR